MGPTKRMVIGAIFLVGPTSLADDWMTQPPLVSGNIVTTACHGLGPDTSVAFKEAMDQCRGLATESLVLSFEVHSLSIQTEQSSGFHQEVESDKIATGLQCKVKKQLEKTTDTGSDLWLLCEFDAFKAKIENKPLIANPSVPFSVMQKSQLTQSENKQIIVSTVPPCETLLIRGAMSRIVNCNNNPSIVFIKPTDEEIIVRASGYVPKHIALSNEMETLNVFLEKL